MKSLVDDALEQVGGGLGEGELVEARIDGCVGCRCTGFAWFVERHREVLFFSVVISVYACSLV